MFIYYVSILPPSRGWDQTRWLNFNADTSSSASMQYPLPMGRRIDTEIVLVDSVF